MCQDALLINGECLFLAWGSAATVALAEEGRWQQVENNPGCSVWNDYSQPNDAVTWTGACADNKAQGRGTQVWLFLKNGEWNKEAYEGDLKDGKREGLGVLVFANGDRYEGDWKNGKRHGRGILVWGPDGEWAGAKYDGEWKDDRRHGAGVYVAANGDRYRPDRA